MKKTLGLVAAALLFATPSLAADEAPAYNCDYQPSCEVAPGIYGAMSTPAKSKFNLSIGGFIMLDYAYNSVNFGANGFYLPGQPAGGMPAVGTVAANQEQSYFSARQSRFWLKMSGPTFLGAKTNAVLESDFVGTATGYVNENGVARLRHAYAALDWATTQLLFGQSSDVFGPATSSQIDQRHGSTFGTPNNPRVAQIRLTQKIPFDKTNSLKLVFGVQNPVEDFQTAGADGTVPNLAGQLMFVSKALGTAPGYYGLSMNDLQAGFFGLYGTQKLTTAGQYHNADVYGYGFYAFVPLLKSRDGKSRAMTASFETEAYIAAGMNWNGANASIPNAGTDALLASVTPGYRTAAKGWGAYGQIIFYPTQDVGITGGYQRRNALNYASYGTTNPKGDVFEEYNELIYGNIAYDLNAAVRFATEYEHAKTQYSKKPAGATGDFGQANIFRFAAYYFF